jgi:non-heme chloroperoxidase
MLTQRLEHLEEIRLNQIVPYANSGPLSAKLVKGAVLKTYAGFPHGMPTTNADQINGDLLEFVKS